MTQESQLQVRPKDSDPSQSLAKLRSSLIARGRKDAAALPAPGQYPAEHGDAEEQFTLGRMYHYGEGVAQDYAEAAKWYLKAAEHGYDEAQFNIGALYSHGQGVAQDHIEAAGWYLKAAKQGHQLARFNIGAMYQNGDGVEQDYSLAARWYRMAAEHPSEDPPRLDPRVMDLQGGGQAHESTQAAEWYRRAAYGFPPAQFNLGLLYEAGAGVPQDYVLAHMWICLALARVNGDSGRYAAARDRVAAKMSPVQVAESLRLADILKQLAEKKAQADSEFWAEFKRKLAARRSDSQT